MKMQLNPEKLLKRIKATDDPRLAMKIGCGDLPVPLAPCTAQAS